MRAAEEILRRRPRARILVVGGGKVSYGSPPADAANWWEKMLAEVHVPTDRTISSARPPYETFLHIVPLSRTHTT